ncbi:mechanosensitive ion channel [Sinorhizobium medicae]|nr:mechanosensitive ion channel [Sinorhizobium medicae]MDX1065078.1 mechanosensitive ion channel [Sinorhizobium medicae]MDX1084530.1 mechanosensitive ion channel [Sinorhizobium medicae]
MSQQTFLLIVLINVLGVAGIVVWHLQGRNRQNERLVTQIFFFMLMTAALAFAKVMPFQFAAPHLEGTGPLEVAAKILWWTHLSWATIGLVRIYIVLDGRPREARLIQDLLVAIVYLGVLLSMMAFVFGVPIGTLVATSGVLAIILGLALQNTLGDVFSGIALTLGRPYIIGDWILLGDGTEGRVVASNWRSTYLLTAGHNQVVLPNSVLAKQSVTNVSKPDETHGVMMPLRVVPSIAPDAVAAVLRDAIENCNSIVHDPPPAVCLVAIDRTAISVELYFRVTSPSQRSVARNEVIDMVYRHCMVHGVEFAMPTGTQIVSSSVESKGTISRAREIVETVSVFAALSSDERDTLADFGVARVIPAGETIVAECSIPQTLKIAAGGILMLSQGGEDLLRLAPGDCLGVRGFFLGNPEAHQARALTRAVVLEIDKSAIASLIAKRPGLTDDLVAWIRSRNAAAAVHGGALVLSDISDDELAIEIRTALEVTV